MTSIGSWKCSRQLDVRMTSNSRGISPFSVWIKWCPGCRSRACAIARVEKSRPVTSLFGKLSDINATPSPNAHPQSSTLGEVDRKKNFSGAGSSESSLSMKWRVCSPPPCESQSDTKYSSHHSREFVGKGLRRIQPPVSQELNKIYSDKCCFVTS